MFRIRLIYDDVLPINRSAITEVKDILAADRPPPPQGAFENLVTELRNPFRQRFRMGIYVAENARRRVMGFANVLDDPEVQFRYLEYLAVAEEYESRGVRTALYEYLRSDASRLDMKGLFLESLPDEPQQCSDPELRVLAEERLWLLEEFGARPVVGTQYETPLPGGPTDCVTHLVYDGLDRDRPLRAAFARKAVRAIFERRYGDRCPPEYVDKVVGSFTADPVPLREPRYLERRRPRPPVTPRPRDRIAVTVNDRHAIHHVRERGYLQWPARVSTIAEEITGSGLADEVKVKEHPQKHITAVHDPKLVSFIRKACAGAPEGKTVYPYVFPVRNAARPPKDLSVRAGYYCIDTFTPISRSAYPAARRAVDTALTAADQLIAGRHLAYALVRPPGHHAERATFGGFCYFNNASICAHYLSRHGKVAMLDLDYHHGNGHQDIFYERSDVLTVSIHGDPSHAYPYFTGFAEETGSGPGEGFNLNLPLPRHVKGQRYRTALKKALAKITEFNPDLLVIPLGLDTVREDPTGTWELTGADLETNGQWIGALRLPTLVVQEGGYRIRTLGVNARRFMQGLLHGAYGKDRGVRP
jgi:acetoin utilization deacetylase AcuC-like enzyme/GNAT superfamily N-acetyltransferase